MHTRQISNARTDNKIRVGIYRDIETPEVDINSAVVGIDKLRVAFGNIAISETHRLVQLTSEPKKVITSSNVNWLETDNHMNFVYTSRILRAGSANLPKEGFGTVGMSVYRPYRKPFVIIDAVHAPHLLDNVVQHEAAHLVKIKDSGKYFDLDDHCNHPRCLMQPIAQKHLDNFCPECSEQLDERLYRLSKLELPGAKMFRHIVRVLSLTKVKTVKPTEPQEDHELIQFK